ncbi:MAG: fatty acid desaturase [Deltaproteobacteria bacterium]|nr:fatty acid desaturase [Deltaproteobacteria bacterium]
MLRHQADWRTVAYLAFSVGLSIVQWHLPHVNPVLYGLCLFMGVATAVISHNHNHGNIWKWKPANVVTSWVISIYYGFPCIAWVPTHNQVHHRLNNKPGDTSRSPKYFKKNHLLALLVYPTLTGIEQQVEIKAFFGTLWKRNKKAWAIAASEYAVFFGFLAVMLFLDWRKALLFFVIPQQFALFTIQVFNYVQHVEADAHSEWNHSRNFVSPVLNALLFNNGYHTVHHLKPGVHWSQTPALHAEHVSKIHPSLLVKSWWGWMFHTFFVRPFTGEAAPDLGSTASTPAAQPAPAMVAEAAE